MYSSTIASTRESIQEKISALGDSRTADLFTLRNRAAELLEQKISETARILRDVEPVVGSFPELQGNLKGEDSGLLAQKLSGELAALLDLRYQPDGNLITVGRNKLSRTLGALRTASEAVAPFEEAVFNLAYTIAEAYPGRGSDSIYLQTARAAIVLGLWELSYAGIDRPLNDSTIIPALLSTFEKGAPLSLTFFVCPPAYFPAINEAIPTDYFPVTTEGSFLNSQTESLRELTQALSALNIPSQVNAIVGDTDEVDYLWPALSTPPGLATTEAITKLSERKELFQESVRRSLLRSEVATDETLTVVRLSALKDSFRAQCSAETRQTLADISTNIAVYSDVDIAEEQARMVQLWTSTKARPAYYAGLPIPDDIQLEDVVRRKFSAYAEEGVILAGLAGTQGSILVQLEQPGPLRNRMLSAGRELLGMGTWPAILRYPPVQKTPAPIEEAVTVAA